MVVMLLKFDDGYVVQGIDLAWVREVKGILER